MKLLFKLILLLAVFAVLVFVALLLYLSITKYEPKPTELLFESIGDTIPIGNSTVYQVVIWNIGYAGLDQSMDFFYDGGKQVRPTRENSKKNFEQIKTTLMQMGDSTHFLMLQEVDKNAKRSYHTHQMQEIAALFPERNTQFAINYNVKFVPLPITAPMGSVQSGLQLISRYQPTTAVRHAFPSDFGFPTNLAMLKRCFLVNSYPTANGKELLIINTHNSAYDDGTLRKDEMNFFKKFLVDEYQKGNYIVVGGDWNQCPPNFTPEYSSDAFDNLSRIDIATDYLPETWQWIFDAATPTNRRVPTSYVQGKSLTTVIDFFLLSPNLELVEVKGHHLGFEASDHNPVTLRFKIH